VHEVKCIRAFVQGEYTIMYNRSKMYSKKKKCKHQVCFCDSMNILHKLDSVMDYEGCHKVHPI
jgi:hypothetical protein